MDSSVSNNLRDELDDELISEYYSQLSPLIVRILLFSSSKSELKAHAIPTLYLSVKFTAFEY